MPCCVAATLSGASLCTRLTTLTVSYNRLESLGTALENCPHLLSLDVSFNLLKSLSGVHKCTRLRTLRAAGNRLTAVEGLNDMKKLTLYV